MHTMHAALVYTNILSFHFIFFTTRNQLHAYDQDGQHCTICGAGATPVTVSQLSVIGVRNLLAGLPAGASYKSK